MNKILGTYSGRITLRKPDVIGDHPDNRVYTEPLKAPPLDQLERLIEDALATAGYAAKLDLVRTDL